MSYSGNFSNGKRAKSRSTRTVTLLLALVLLTGVVAGSLAYLLTHTDAVQNLFTPVSVPNTPVEEFDGETKSSIVIKNEGDIAAYIRVKLVSYRVNEDGAPIGGTAVIPDFDLGAHWVEYEGYYYYTLPVDVDASTGELLGSPIPLVQYTDADGGKQVIEVISESIQSVPAEAIGDAWGVEISVDQVSAYQGGKD